ncbi:MAG: pullulanase-type alpha-1,6-glucosidase [Propionibacteriaceae bacterium]|nr:pullulanase-type alpha-1,6-glucosidase [Propionibacteriaceae bacterium]
MSLNTRSRKFLAALTALPLVLAGLVSPGVTPLAAAADLSVVVAGSFQSGLGCDADWAQSCEATALVETEADSGLYTGTFNVPAGEQEFKIVLDGDWEQSFGANNDAGNNATLNLPAAMELTFAYDSASKRIGVTGPELLPSGEDVAGDADIAKPAVRNNDVENFYFVMTDRFANGDTSNDTGGIAGDALQHGFDPTNEGFYHGGDIKGLVDNLDYIEGLGTTAIWLTPSFTNNPVQGSGDGASAGYHGYWITDFTTIDPHLGGNASLTALTDAAHARGMKVYFDIITNHTADGIDYEEGKYSYIPVADSPYKDAAGNIIDIAALAGSAEWPALDAATSFPYTPTLRDGVTKTPAWLNDTTLYHNRGDSTWTGESVTLGDFVGLDDLMTEHPTVVDGMVDIYTAWMDMGVDGFRIDTVKHVNFEFWEEWTADLKAHAATVNPDFFMFGEVYDADPAKLAPYLRRTDMDATLDFTFQSSAANFAKGFSTQGLSALYEGDDLYLTSDTSAATMPTFLGNHDMGRVGFFLKDSDKREDRSMLAHELMYLTRGQPVVYYGDEQGFVGSGGDKAARQDMFGTQVDSYATQQLLNGDTVGTADRYDTDTLLYEGIADLAELRADHPALADGAQFERLASSGAGVYAFSRVDRDEKIEYLVALNNATTDKTVEVTTLTPSAGYTPIRGGSAVTSSSDGVVSVTVPALSSVVLKADTTVASSTGAVALDVADGAAVTGDTVPMSATIDENRWAETTFAMRTFQDAATWSTIGVAEDDTPRVYGDVSALAVGTPVQVRAVSVSLDSRSGDSALVWVGQDFALTPGDDGEVPGEVEVTIPGSHNAAMGCPGDWQPDCAAAALSLDEGSGLWTGVFTVPAGSYEWKVAYNGSWDESYGAPDGGNLSYTTDGTPLRFFHNPETKLSWVVNVSGMVTLPGNWQAALGCPGDWQPECIVTAMRPLGDGTWVFETDSLPAGSYEIKVAIGGSWDENYGVGGAPGGGNYQFTTGAGEIVKVMYDEISHLLTIDVANPPLVGVGQAWAQWLTPEVIAWPKSLVPGDLSAMTWALHHDPIGGVTVAETVTGGERIALAYGGNLPADLVAKFPHLKDYVALTVPANAPVAQALTGELVVSAADGDVLRSATSVQIAPVLDALYGDAVKDVDLGPVWSGTTPTLRVWAPTAKDVALHRWPASGAGDPVAVDATKNADGTWSVTGDATWKDAQYLWSIDVYVPSADKVVTNDVTDPYSLGLTLNSTRSVIVDLDDPALAPQQWRDTPAPTVRNDSSRAIWELHVRDFSVADESVPEAERGTYKAFTRADSTGMKHLAKLAEAGIDTVHLLPTFDIATIEEDRTKQAVPDIPADAGPASEAQQAAVSAVADEDAYNWGYDPLHWSTPEGSYATDANQSGGKRSYEFREMVGALHGTGLQVVLDKVYNHTASSGQSAKSVLDRVVPGYYHRLSPSGTIETSTCCENIATENVVAQKMMVDSVVTWARDYHVDGFRFDLMGHHSRASMEAVRAALDGLTMATDGVDGSAIYLYGEGWNFGEVADNARFLQATQGQLDGTGIGAFNDRLRDAVHGGGPFDDDHRVNQGLGTGLYTDPNGLSTQTPAEQLATLKRTSDLVRLGMAGNLKDYAFTASDGTVKKGSEFDYNGQPAGYASTPQESVNYVDAHDNETLYDLAVMKLPVGTSMADRVRMNTISLASVALGQSPSFWHAGTEILRSKSLDRDSYNSGDHFNAMDWTLESSTYGTGLPVKEKNGEKWPIMKPLLENPALTPDKAAMEQSLAQSLDLLRLRKSTPLLSLGTSELVKERVTFPGAGKDQVPGLVLMAVDDRAGEFAVDIDEALDGALVAINATPEVITTKVPELAGRQFSLSAVQADGADDVVKSTTWVAADGTLSIPARTAALLVEKAAVIEPTPSATPTKTASPSPTASPTSGQTDLYSTPGYHNVNGRQWFTTCEPYSQTVRCRTSIWATQVTFSNGTYQPRTGWYFNNMTYLPYMKRSQWVGNPLGQAGEWTATDGRKWRTECDTPVTGGNGCRSWAWAGFIASKFDAKGNRVYYGTSGWVFNNIVRFKAGD